MSEPIETAEVLVTKLAAAQRQLDAAIRLWLAKEDPLAIHTLVSASYAIVTDLKFQRGRDETVDWLMRGAYFFAKDYLDGTISRDILLEKGVWSVVEPVISLLEDNPAISLDDFRCMNSEDNRRTTLRETRKVSNFLKHADKDASSFVSESETRTRNYTDIQRCMTAYLDLGSSITNSMHALHIFCSSRDDPLWDVPISQFYRPHVEKMRALPEHKRRRLALQIAARGLPD